MELELRLTFCDSTPDADSNDFKGKLKGCDAELEAGFLMHPNSFSCLIFSLLFHHTQTLSLALLSLCHHIPFTFPILHSKDRNHLSHLLSFSLPPPTLQPHLAPGQSVLFLGNSAALSPARRRPQTHMQCCSTSPLRGKTHSPLVCRCVGGCMIAFKYVRPGCVFFFFFFQVRAAASARGRACVSKQMLLGLTLCAE